jgi:hypothetical protein
MYTPNNLAMDHFFFAKGTKPINSPIVIHFHTIVTIDPKRTVYLKKNEKVTKLACIARTLIYAR